MMIGSTQDDAAGIAVESKPDDSRIYGSAQDDAAGIVAMILILIQWSQLLLMCQSSSENS